jgi:hypothetical protein
MRVTFWDVQYWSTDFAQTLEHSHASVMRIAKQLAEAKACELI